MQRICLTQVIVQLGTTNNNSGDVNGCTASICAVSLLGTCTANRQELTVEEVNEALLDEIKNERNAM